MGYNGGSIFIIVLVLYFSSIKIIFVNIFIVLFIVMINFSFWDFELVRFFLDVGFLFLEFVENYREKVLVCLYM